MNSRKPLLPVNRDTTVALGVVSILAGCLLLWDGYDRRGRRRPLAIRLLAPLPI